jgi:syncollin
MKGTLVRGLVAASVVAASIVVQVAPALAGCTLYEDRDYRGARWRLGAGDWLMGACSEDQGSTSGGKGYCRPDWNDQISSYKVTSDCQVILSQHVVRGRGGGAEFSRGFGVSVKYVGTSWNDQASWAECVCQ